jgi:chaperone required for assembly of F1-ATPase
MGQAVRLDGRPVKTPTGNALALPTQKMADAVVAEWDAVEKSLNPALMRKIGKQRDLAEILPECSKF